MVTKVHDNATYTVRELDGIEHRVPYAGKRVKLFKQRSESTINKNSKKDLEDVYDKNVEEELE